MKSAKQGIGTRGLGRAVSLWDHSSQQCLCQCLDSRCRYRLELLLGFQLLPQTYKNAVRLFV